MECHNGESTSEIVVVPFKNEGVGYNYILSIQLLRKFSKFEVKIIKELLKVINIDLEKFPYYSYNDLWISLKNTRILRVISRISVISSENFMEWADTMEKICRMSHEGESFSLNLLLLRNIKNIEIPNGGELLQIPNAKIRMDQLLNYKWIRAIANDRDISLVALNTIGVVSFLIIPETRNETYEFSNIHRSYDKLTSLVSSGVELICASNNNDLFIVLNGGNVFLNSRMGWRYYNINPLINIIKKHTCNEYLSKLIAKLIFEKSFERDGCLFCIIEEEYYTKIVNSDEINYFNKFVKERSIENKINYDILHKFSSIDGAVVLSNSGYILGIACNLKVSLSECQDINEKNRMIEGSRRRAAIDSSKFGISICVSDDGPISVFENGSLLFNID
jgi:hypothetical protein